MQIIGLFRHPNSPSKKRTKLPYVGGKGDVV